MSDIDAVLFANEAFYRAFADRDEQSMETLWSKTQRVACIHPGWGPLFDREEVLASWKAIIQNPEAPDILCHDAHGHILGNTAYVICFEEIGGNFLVATNIFIREGKVWKLVHHQAGPTSVRPQVRGPSPAGSVN